MRKKIDFKVPKDIKLNDIVKNMASSVYSEGKWFCFMPFWFEDDGDYFTLHHLDKLPDDLRDKIEFMRNYKNNQ